MAQVEDSAAAGGGRLVLRPRMTLSCCSTLFVSYRQESPEHARVVRRLCEKLRQARIPIAFDQFYVDDKPGGPDDGWPKWCEDSASKSACSLIIASEGWFAAYDKTVPAAEFWAPPRPRQIFSAQKFWDEAGHNSRIRVAFLHPLAADKVPDRLRTWRIRPLVRIPTIAAGDSD